MTVTPEQIEGASFSTVKRGGYRTEEVDRFLRTLADEFRTLAARVRSAEGANEDLQAASAEMATLMRDVHAQLGEKRRVADIEIEDMRAAAEREAAGVIAAASERADGVRIQADRVLADAERHAELLRSDGEQRVRETAEETLRAARADLQDLVRRKHEVLHALSSIRSELASMESSLESTALTPDALDDSIINTTLSDLGPGGVGEHAVTPPPPPPPTPSQLTGTDGGSARAHPAANPSNSFFNPPEE